MLHPRVRGGATTSRIGNSLSRGPSPRARGGPTIPPRGIWAWSVHPRVRGGAYNPIEGDLVLVGPSPRARGSLLSFGFRNTTPGSIPACAGEPNVWYDLLPHPEVHPRVRGGAIVLTSLEFLVSGPSPRARGSPGEIPAPLFFVGSIPACAGEPSSGAKRAFTSQVHPRVRGGAFGKCFIHVNVSGPSPRARGSPL